MRIVDCVERVLGFDVETIGVVEPAVPRFRDNRQRPPVTGGVGLAMTHAPLNDGVANDTDAVRVGNHDGAFQKAGLLDPGDPGHFTVSVLRKPSSEYRIVHGIFTAGENGGYTGADRAFADFEFALAGNQRGVPDKDAGNVGDGILRARRAVEGNAEVARARFCLRFFLSLREKWNEEGKKDRKEKAGMMANHSFSQE